MFLITKWRAIPFNILFMIPNCFGLSRSKSVSKPFSIYNAAYLDEDNSGYPVINLAPTSSWTFGARCSSVVRAFAHGAMDCRIDPS